MPSPPAPRAQRTCLVCGASFEILVSKLKFGKGLYCSTRCQHDHFGQRSFRHGHCADGVKSGSPTYASWSSMKERCNRPACASYKDYGARGITYAPEWESFENFLADMGEKPEGTSLDRIDYNGNYGPKNCRWATRIEQNQNRRTVVVVEYFGERLCVAELARRLGLDHACLMNRIRKGWPKEAWSYPSGSVRKWGQIKRSTPCIDTYSSTG